MEEYRKGNEQLNFLEKVCNDCDEKNECGIYYDDNLRYFCRFMKCICPENVIYEPYNKKNNINTRPYTYSVPVQKDDRIGVIPVQAATSYEARKIIAKELCTNKSCPFYKGYITGEPKIIYETDTTKENICAGGN